MGDAVLTLLCAADIGRHGLGLSFFWIPTQELVHAEYSGGLGGQVDPFFEPVEPAVHIVEQVTDKLGSVERLVVEVPQVYDQQRWGGDPKDLVDLAWIGGAFAREVAVKHMRTRACGGSVLRPRPAQWKGQVNKDVMIERIKGRLSETEMNRVELPNKSVQHNVWDAVGIGLWELKRIGK